MTPISEDTGLIQSAIAYVIELYREISGENGAPTSGTQNQAVDFILADPELRRAVGEWGNHAGVEEASTAAPQRLPLDETYRRICEFMLAVMEQPVFAGKDRD